ncbi:MAG: hypothetical protein U1F43_24470 [Myxococcota bacterium]
MSVELRDGLAADQRLVDTVLFASTRGPTFTPGATGGSAADPTLTMGPELAAPGQGTALAAAYVAGVVALVREAHPDWSADVIAAQLVATTAPAWSASEPLVGGSPSAGGAGRRARRCRSAAAAASTPTRRWWGTCACGPPRPAPPRRRSTSGSCAPAPSPR